MQKLVSLLFLLLACLMASRAQNVITTTYDDRSGLSHWIVSDVAQDRQGFIWLSTWNGLNRFDGYMFKQIKVQPGDGTNIQSQVIRQMVMDDDGDILCLTSDGVFKLDTKSYRLADMPDSVRIMIPHNSHPSSFQDREGNLWQVQRYGITKTSPTHHPAQLVEGTGNVQARAFLRDRQNRWWLATKEDECIRIYQNNGDHTDKPLSDSATTNRLLRYLGQDGKLHQTRTPFGYRAYSIAEAANGDIWMGCKPGALLRLREQDDGTYQIKRITAEGLACDVIYHIVEDNDGRLWLATFGGGVHCLVNPSADEPFCVNFVGNEAFFDGAEKVRRILLTNSNNIICATTNGLVVGSINPEDIARSTFQRLLRNGQQVASLAGNAVMDVVCDGKGRIFIATENNGIDMITEECLFEHTATGDLQSLTFRHFNCQNSSLTSDVCLAITVKDDGRLFVVCSDQVMDFDPDSDQTVTFSRRFWNTASHFSEERPLQLPDGSWLFGQEQGAYIASSHSLYTPGYQPPLVFTELTVDGQPSDMGLCTKDTIVIDTDERNFTITFAALDYTDNSGIRYRHRLDDAPWSHADSEHSLTFHDLQPGEYVLKVQSTDRYGRWADNTRQITIIVLPHWYETLWARILAWLLVAVLITAVIYTIFYVRQLNMQRRELLEKYMRLIDTNSNANSHQVAQNEEHVSGSEPATDSTDSLPAQLSDADRKFLDRVMAYIEANLANSDANIDDMASAAATSRSSLNRKLHSLVGITAAQLLIDARMRKARQLLSVCQNSKPNIADIAYRCGYSDARYFSRCFKQKYGITPSEALSETA